ncbi:Uncharacterised protein [Vibrio cholerae]|nr:Uncharacterised protein [Vibrio cholerae]CSI58933.1 Uncharacterised protein [Vibrio cholerae]
MTPHKATYQEWISLNHQECQKYHGYEQAWI